MMTAKRLEKITGHEVSLSQQNGQVAAAVLCDCGDEAQVIYEAGRDLATVLGEICRAVYKHHSLIVMKKQRWVCAECERRRPLTIHHVIHRSKGRSDAVGNLTAICLDCHERETNP